MEVAFDVLVTRACTLDTEAQVIVAGPAVHLGVGNLGMELHGDGRTVAERLVGVGTGGSGKKPRAVRKPEPFPMPLVDVLGEGSERLGCRGGEDRVVVSAKEIRTAAIKGRKVKSCSGSARTCECESLS